MRNLLLTLFVLGLVTTGSAEKNRKQRKAQEKMELALVVEKMLDEKVYTFEATSAQPMGFRSIPISVSYGLEMKNDSVFIDLPFFGRAYSASVGEEGGIKFEGTYDNYKETRTKNGREISFEAKAPNEVYQIYLALSNSLNGVLTVTSNKKQSISFNGRLIEPEEE